MIFVRLNTTGLFYSSLLVFLVIEISDFIIPFGHSGTVEGQVLYYLIVFFYLLSFYVSSFYSKKVCCSLPSDFRFNKLITRLYYFSLLGLMLVLYDRLFIQQVDYSQGVALARESWRENAKDRVGASSVFNVIGNLIFPLFYVVFFFLVSFFEKANSNSRAKLKWAVFFILLFSGLTGGREPVLVFLSVLVSSLVFRKSCNLSILPKEIRGVTIFLCLLVVVFSIAIGLIRTQVYSFSLYEYGVSLSSRLGGTVVSDIHNIAPDSLFPVLIYLAHTKWVFINILSETQALFGLSTFRQIWMMFHQYMPGLFGSYNTLPPLYTPNWISLVGSIYYDIGFIFLFVVLFMPAFFLVLLKSVFSIKTFNVSMVSFVVYCYLVAFLCFSLFSFLFETVQFIYILFSLPLLLFFYYFERLKIK